jgi:Zn-dependent protease
VLLALISINLAMFNLLPIAPLDGSHILSALLPVESARKYDRFMAQYGMFIFLGFIFVGGSLLRTIVGPISKFIFGLLTGIGFPF